MNMKTTKTKGRSMMKSSPLDTHFADPHFFQEILTRESLEWLDEHAQIEDITDTIKQGREHVKGQLYTNS